MKQNKTPQMQFMTHKGYASLVRKAQEFVEVLTGDAAYERPEVNRVALESMLIGWLTSTLRWKQYVAFCDKRYPRENPYLLAQDQAMQAAQDAIFDGRDSVVTWFCTLKELNEMIDALPPRRKVAFAAKVGKLTEFRQMFTA